jgi:hypothetical protein
MKEWKVQAGGAERLERVGEERSSLTSEWASIFVEGKKQLGNGNNHPWQGLKCQKLALYNALPYSGLRRTIRPELTFATADFSQWSTKTQQTVKMSTLFGMLIGRTVREARLSKDLSKTGSKC